MISRRLLRRTSQYVALFCGVFFYGCASLSESECRSGDWYAIGFRDGSHGYDGTRLAAHREACTDYAIVPNHDSWEAGRQEGLKRYCRTETAYDIGRSGDSFRFAVCPDIKELHKAYNRGVRVFETEQELDSLRQERDRLIAEAEAALKEGSFATTREAVLFRENIRLKIRNLDTQISVLKFDLMHYRR